MASSRRQGVQFTFPQVEGENFGFICSYRLFDSELFQKYSVLRHRGHGYLGCLQLISLAASLNTADSQDLSKKQDTKRMS